MPLHQPRPLSLIACAFAVGITLDAIFPLSLVIWLLLLIACLVTYRFVSTEWRASSLLLMATLAFGGAWHHDRTLLFSTNDISTFAGSERRLCRLRGLIEGEVVTVEPNPADAALSSTAENHTHFVLVVQKIENGGKWESIDGKTSVVVRGELAKRRSGDEVELVGWLSRPRVPLNPGEFDYRRFLETQRILASFFVETPAAIQVLGTGPLTSFTTWREKARGWASSLLSTHLSASSARLGDSLLLGIRSSLPADELLPFIESGTIHVLVVSGLHVGLMAMLAWRLFGVARLTLWQQALSTILVIAAYTFLTGANPPAVRAGVLAAIFFGEYLFVRSTEPINSLAASALVVLLADPADLFRPGPQLSFLCAFAILAILPLVWLRGTDSPASRQVVNRIARVVGNLVISSVLLWLVTAPLVAQQFHLLAPISVLGSVILIPLTTIALYVGVLFFFGFWIPLVGTGLAWMLDVLLWLTGEASQWTASWEGLSLYVAGPTASFVVAWYLLLIIPWLWPSIWPLGRIHIRLLVGCLLVGVLLECWPSRPSEVEYHQLAVGHGNAGVLRTPDGRTVLFDAGSIAGPKITSRVIAPFLWDKRVRRIDAIILSHSDIDHFNGLMMLARRFAIGEVFVPPSFVHDPEPAAGLILDELRRRQIAVRFLWREDTLSWDGVTLRVLHPPVRFVGSNDNAASLVIRLEHGGRSLLSTGDVEGDGLQALLREKPAPVDVLIAPHHGAASSNTPQFADDVRPKLVISSQGKEPRTSDPLAVYSDRGARAFSTNIDGCVSIRWTEEGLIVHAFANGEKLVIP